MSIQAVKQIDQNS